MNKLSTALILSLIIILGGLLFMQQAEADPLALDEPQLPETPFNYSDIVLPRHLAFLPDNSPADNPITDDGATLGRVLFYDVRLSANDTISCASCHLQEAGFSDPAQFSVGFEGGHTGRNSMGLSNARFFQSTQFFWDTRANSLEQLALLPIQDPIEMGSNLPDLIDELSATAYYPDLFDKAFGSPEINPDRISKAMAQFVRSIVSYQSKYDVGVAIDFANFTEQELQGKTIFEGRQANCSLCHLSDTQILIEPKNNGLDLVYADQGLGDVTGNSLDNGKFKPPSLRNVALTAPYMHDGRFESLEQVVAHYANGTRAHPNLDPFLSPGGQIINPTAQEAIVAFLHTLTDYSLAADIRYSDPFNPPAYDILLPLLENN